MNEKDNKFVYKAISIMVCWITHTLQAKLHMSIERLTFMCIGQSFKSLRERQLCVSYIGLQIQMISYYNTKIV